MIPSFILVTPIPILLYTKAISNHFTAFQRKEGASPQRGRFEQRARRIREETGIPLMRLDDDAHSPPSWVSRPEIGLAGTTLAGGGVIEPLTKGGEEFVQLEMAEGQVVEEVSVGSFRVQPGAGQPLANSYLGLVVHTDSNC